MTLHTVAPKSMQEDEHVIGRTYNPKADWLIAGVPLVVAAFFDVKWVVASGFTVGLLFGFQLDARLHDLCIRLKRSNALLVERLPADRQTSN
jgi:hypothetical protein